MSSSSPTKLNGQEEMGHSRAEDIPSEVDFRVVLILLPLIFKGKVDHFITVGQAAGGCSSQCGWSNRARMDISVLPNNNHPEKFLQLDVGMLPATHGMFQVGAVMSSQRHWQNRVYSQREERVITESWSPPSPQRSPVVFVDRYLEKHITPVTLKSNIKRNPLYMAIRSVEAEDDKKPKPCWTVRERRRSLLKSWTFGSRISTHQDSTLY
ncbi:major intrinsically disordered Notch2-binding receptor 1-like isoform X2 [Larimichthys crocea]|nr:major intrinsically disordered Notch2-binding receptor 1-like isoform X2 [Larimichthys crocea]